MFNINKRILRQALDLSPLATIIVDLKNHPHPVVYVNQAFEAISGYDAGELIGHPWSELLVNDEAPEQPVMDEVGTEVRLNCHPRLAVTDELRLNLLPIYDQPGAPRYWVGTEIQRTLDDETADTERDALISVLRDTQMRLRSLDGRDSASGVLSRRAFDNMLQRDWLMARREKRQLTLMVLRIEGFAAYREVFGKHAADSCLAKVGHAITGTLRRAGDLTARLSDDQFAALVGKTDKKDALKQAEKIASKVRGLSIHHPRSSVDRFVTVSFAVASGVPTAEFTAAELLDQATEQLQDPTDSSGVRLGSV